MEPLDRAHPWLNAARTLKRSAELLQSGLAKYIYEYAEEFNAGSELHDPGDWPIDPQDYSEFRMRIEGYIEGYSLLMGYAIENLIKCISIQRYKIEHPTQFDYSFVSVEKNVWKASPHGIRQIAKGCKFSLSEEEDQILRSLEQDIKWAAKYPFPKSDADFQKAVQENLLRRKRENDVFIDNLYERMRKELDTNDSWI